MSMNICEYCNKAWEVGENHFYVVGMMLHCREEKKTKHGNVKK